MKFAILQIHPEVFRQLLQLPENAIVRRINVPHDKYGVVEVTVENVGWETAEAQVIMTTTGQMVDGEIDWGFE